MPDFHHLQPRQECRTGGAVTASSVHTTITANASANTKGSWTELVAATPKVSSYNIFALKKRESGNQVEEFLADFAIGAVSSEVVIAENLFLNLGQSSSLAWQTLYPFPLCIPAGVRVSARCQSTTGSEAMEAGFYSIGGGMQVASPQELVTYGANEADSGGTQIDPGGSANTKGSYTEITSSSAQLDGFCFAIGRAGNVGTATGDLLIDIAVGAVSSEVDIVTNFHVAQTYAEAWALHYSPYFPLSVPAGSRISVRGQCSHTNASDRVFDIIIYGVRK